MDILYRFRDASFLFQREHWYHHQCFLRNDVRIHYHRSYDTRWYRVPFTWDAVLAKPDAVDWWTGDCLFYDCYSPDLYHRRRTALFCRDYRSDSWPHASQNQCNGEMAVDCLSDIDRFGDDPADVWRNGFIWCHLSIICYYGDRRIFYQTKQYFLLEFSVYRVCCRYLYDYLQY